MLTNQNIPNICHAENISDWLSPLNGKKCESSAHIHPFTVNSLCDNLHMPYIFLCVCFFFFSSPLHTSKCVCIDGLWFRFHHFDMGGFIRSFSLLCHGEQSVWDCSHLYLIRYEVQVQRAPLRIHIQRLFNCIKQPLQQLCQWLHHCRNRYNTYKEIQECSYLDAWSLITNFMPSFSAPCPPGSLEALLDCQENQALVSWLGTRSMISFTATMEDQHGGFLSCSTTANSCRIPDLKCGQVYDISVIYHDGICPSMPSHAIQMKSGKERFVHFTSVMSFWRHTLIKTRITGGHQSLLSSGHSDWSR